MKKILVCALILTLLCAISLSVGGCTKTSVRSETWKASKYNETLDLSAYDIAFEDEFIGELDRDVWGDTRQGTRRDGFWSKNLAYTDGEGHLVIRTERRGSRWCSETEEKTVTGFNGSHVTLKYDDCNPFGMIAGDFGDLSDLTAHTSDPVGYNILSHFNLLGASFASFLGKYDLPTEGADFYPKATSEALGAYNSFFEIAMELYNYYSFVAEIKAVSTLLNQSAVIGANFPYVMTFGNVITPQSVDYRGVLARLFGFATEEAFVTAAESLADRYVAYQNELAAGGSVNGALENGCFRSEDGSFLFPIAIQNDSAILLTYVIVDAAGRVSVWVNDAATLLRMTNYSAEYFTASAVKNETYCKNILFVTGPEGVYSGALRTRDLLLNGFGYYEIRCKLPSVEGIWHAFWMMCGNVYSEENGSEDGVEIDVFEYLPARDAVNCALHWDGYDEAHKNLYKRFENTGFADGKFHTFGMKWDDDGYTFYIDGKKVWNTTGGGVCHEPGYLKISTEYGEWGSWVGTLSSSFTAVDWIIDYVKVYAKR